MLTIHAIFITHLTWLLPKLVIHRLALALSLAGLRTIVLQFSVSIIGGGVFSGSLYAVSNQFFEYANQEEMLSIIERIVNEAKTQKRR